ncbi:hypothetical protein [Mesoterricola sediminis]|uniref:Uncharacterized protein n=1 Tax=Mesoterricola sediminis TaxID=2927980 RepID=A0AA48KBU6_9BACT|nr:hypothetical protein [Mesoterricola sediminis]BDU76251.1 hypothetical protein METESE_12090 [Mesoterricola sediminis]
MDHLFDPEDYTQAIPKKEDPFPPGYFKGKPRPDRDNEDIKRLVVEECMEDVLEWFNEEKDEEEQEEIREQLLDVLDDFSDGYEMAKTLEDRHFWDANSSLVELLDGVSSHEVHGKAVLAWIRDNDVKPKLAVGAQVKVKKWSHDKDTLDGEIIKISEDGRYTVFIPSQGHVRSGCGTHGQIFDWEEVEALNPAA